MTDAFTSALSQARLVRSGEVSSVELVELYARRIEALDGRLGSFLTLCLDRAMDEARSVRPGDPRPFAGVPISIKDLYDTEGVRTTYGSAAFAEHVPGADEESVRRIRAAGFVVLGKTNTSEFGSVPWTEPRAFHAAHNPWDIERTPGGSSGGAAAGVAAGLVPLAQASDGGGSIRIPASVCGVFGLKPSRGRVSAAPGPFSLLSQRGPIARTVADAAALLDVMAGPAPGDAFWAPSPERSFLGSAGVEPGRLRIAFTTRPIAPVEVAPANRAAVEEAAGLLEQLGHEVWEEAPPADESLLYRFPVLWAVSMASRTPRPNPDLVEPLNRELMRMGDSTSAPDHQRTWEDLDRALRPVASFFHSRVDVLLMPSVATPPPRIGEFRNDEQPLMELIRAGSFTPFTSLWNVTGQPAVSVPWSFDSLGLPVGVQLVGRPADESTLFRLSTQLETARPWGDHRPPGFDEG
ncbi:MAG TPA: amidase [Actinomycetota bacterium]|nr:amidase [Actinomycetota bacterium]